MTLPKERHNQSVNPRPAQNKVASHGHHRAITGNRHGQPNRTCPSARSGRVRLVAHIWRSACLGDLVAEFSIRVGSRILLNQRSRNSLIPNLLSGRHSTANTLGSMLQLSLIGLSGCWGLVGCR